MAGLEPIYIYLGDDDTGAAETRWECPHCHQRNPRRKPLTAHMGLIVNISPSCPALKAQDEKRRSGIEKHMERVRAQGYEDMWVWSPEELEALRREASGNK